MNNEKRYQRMNLLNFVTIMFVFCLSKSQIHNHLLAMSVIVSSKNKVRKTFANIVSFKKKVRRTSSKKQKQ